MAKSKNIGNVAVVLTASTTKFRAGMLRAAKILKRFAKTIPAILRVAAKLGTVLAAVAGGGLAALTKRSLESIDALAKVGAKLGILPDRLQALRHAAELSGVATNTLDMALQRMVRRVAEAAGGTGEAKDALVELGLDAKALARLAPDEMFQRIAKAMSKVGPQADRVRLAFKLFDSGGVALVNTLKGVEGGLGGVTDFLRRSGVLVTSKQARAVEAFSDAWLRVKTVFVGLGNQIAIKLAPILTDLANRFVDWATVGNTASVIVSNAIRKTAITVGFLGNVWVNMSIEFDLWKANVLRGLAAVQDAARAVVNTINSAMKRATNLAGSGALGANLVGARASQIAGNVPVIGGLLQKGVGGLFGGVAGLFGGAQSVGKGVTGAVDLGSAMSGLTSAGLKASAAAAEAEALRKQSAKPFSMKVFDWLDELNRKMSEGADGTNAMLESLQKLKNPSVPPLATLMGARTEPRFGLKSLRELGAYLPGAKNGPVVASGSGMGNPVVKKLSRVESVLGNIERVIRDFFSRGVGLA